MAVTRPRSRRAPNGAAHTAPSQTAIPQPAPTEVDPDATFVSLGVPASIIDVLARDGVTAPFPIQTATLPYTLAGRDVLGRGRTGSGKTYSFAIPLVTRLAASSSKRRPHRPRALILAPTRELVSQIDAAIAPLAAAFSMRTMTIFGGVGYGPQTSALRAGVDIVVACPGRLADHISEGNASLDSVEITVLDEADHMADLGFLPVVRRLMEQTPEVGQRMLFSATLDAGVDVLVKRFLSNPVTMSVDTAQSPVGTMSHHVFHVRTEDRLPVLVDLTAAPGRTLVFTRTKHRSKMLTKQLIASGVPAVELHGNLAQNARTRNLQAFSDGTARTLVATDIAARGIHVDDVTLVIHADPPAEHKAYLHRSGRTARAGAAGTVITLMTDEQVADVTALARQAGIKPTTTRLRPGHALLEELAPGERTFVAPAPPAPADEAQQQGGGRRRAPRTANSSGRGNGASASSGRTASTGGRTAGTGTRTAGTGRGAASSTRGTSGGAARSTGAASATRYSTSTGGESSGGAAAFSSSTRVGRRAR